MFEDKEISKWVHQILTNLKWPNKNMINNGKNIKKQELTFNKTQIHSVSFSHVENSKYFS